MPPQLGHSTEFDFVHREWQYGIKNAFLRAYSDADLPEDVVVTDQLEIDGGGGPGYVEVSAGVALLMNSCFDNSLCA